MSEMLIQLVVTCSICGQQQLAEVRVELFAEAVTYSWAHVCRLGALP